MPPAPAAPGSPGAWGTDADPSGSDGGHPMQGIEHNDKAESGSSAHHSARGDSPTQLPANPEPSEELIEEDCGESDPPPPPDSATDSAGRTVVPCRMLADGEEVEITGLTNRQELNGAIGQVMGSHKARYFVHIPGELGGDEVVVERHNLVHLEQPRWLEATSELGNAGSNNPEEAAVAAVRVRGLQGALKPLNGLYRRAGIKGDKFEQRIVDSDGVTQNILWKDTRDGRWKMHNEDCTRGGWQPSNARLLGQWVEDPSGHDGSLASGQPYPYITRASAAEHCHTER